MLYTADKLGEIIKTSRLKMGLTRDQLSEKIGISPRYLMSIEHEGKKPSYDVLFQLIRYLTINANDIFFPESISYLGWSGHQTIHKPGIKQIP